MSVTRVVLGKLSPTMEEGKVVRWLKAEGERVREGDVLAEIETDKADMEMEALGSGVLRRILVPAGGSAPVGALIGVIAGPDEDISAVLAEASGPAPATPRKETPSPPAAAGRPAPDEPAPPAAPTPGPPPPTPLAPPSVPGQAPPAPAAPAGRVKASPLARSIAARLSIPLAAVPGTGPGGRVVRRDVEAWQPPAERAVPAAPPGPAVRRGQAVPHTGMRRTIARRLSESKLSAPHFYVTMEVDMARAVALREELARAEGLKVSVNDLVLRACARALVRFPAVNASWTDEAVVTHADVHLGVAVALPEGLVTPVVRHADRKGVLDIGREVKELAARARERKLKPEEYGGSTFTVSNLGMMGVSAFTAIINPPEAAILAVGAVRTVPVVVDGRVEVGERMSVTLSADHRVVDGALAAAFLQEVRRLLESPISLFVAVA